MTFESRLYQWFAGMVDLYKFIFWSIFMRLQFFVVSFYISNSKIINKRKRGFSIGY